MAKKKFSADILKKAGKQAHMQPGKIELTEAVALVGGERLSEIDVDRIYNNPMQPRRSIDEEALQELAMSIKREGLIQPIAVYKGEEEGTYILKAGQRRWLAHKLLGMPKIKAVISDKSFEDDIEEARYQYETAMAENVHRADLDPLEAALSIRGAIDRGLYRNMEEAAKGIRKSKSYVAKLLKVLQLDPVIIEDLEKNKSTSDLEALYFIQRIEDKKRQVQAYRDFIAKKIDRAGLKELVRAASMPTKPSQGEPFEIHRKGKKISVSINLGKGVKKDPSKAEEEVRGLLESALVKNEQLVPVDSKAVNALRRIEEGYYFGMFKDIAKNEEEEYAIRDAIFALAEGLKKK